MELAVIDLWTINLSGLQFLYGVCLLTGLALLSLNLLLGALSGGLDAAVDLDVDIDTAIDLNSDGLGSILLPLRPMSMLTMVTVFGAIGTMLSTVFALAWPELLICGIAAVTGYLMAVIINRFVLQPLSNNQADALHANHLVGSTAEVTVRIRPGKVGEVSIKTEQGIFNYPACLFDQGCDQVLEAGMAVGIMGITKDRSMVRVVGLDMQKWQEQFKG